MPFLAFSEHEGLPPAAIFRKPVEDRGVDIEFKLRGETHRLQITTAYPLWDGVSNAGYDNRLRMEKLTATGGFVGSGPFRRHGTEIVNNKGCTSCEEVEKACRSGLENALASKSKHGDLSITLLVCTMHFFPAISDTEQFRALIDSALINAGSLRFGRVDIIDPVGGLVYSRVTSRV